MDRGPDAGDTVGVCCRWRVSAVVTPRGTSGTFPRDISAVYFLSERNDAIVFTFFFIPSPENDGRPRKLENARFVRCGLSRNLQVVRLGSYQVVPCRRDVRVNRVGSSDARSISDIRVIVAMMWLSGCPESWGSEK